MKIVLTGGPSCGKTTLINTLKSRGYKVMDEIARKVIKDNKFGKKLTAKEGIDLQTEIYKRQLAQEHILDKSNKVVFLDRGYIDGIAYCKHLSGYVPKELFKADIKRYDAVFVLDMLPFSNDGLRRENKNEAIKIHNMIIKEYQAEGYKVIRVQDIGIEKRIKFILSRVEKLK